MRVVVSGATGFLGQALCGALKRRGCIVAGIGRDRGIGQALAEAGIGFVAADLSQPPTQALQAALGHAEIFVHAAALSSPWGSASDFERHNVTASRHALALAQAAHCRRFVFVSSPSVYFRFADQHRLSESTPLPRPVNAYAATKRRAEAIVLAAAELSPVVLRPRALYGAGDRALLPRLIAAARHGPLPLMRGGRAVTDLTHVDDAVAAVLCAIDAPAQAGGKIFNVAGPESVPVRMVIEQACGRAGVPVSWRGVPWPLVRAAAGASEALARLRPGRPEPRVTLYGAGVLAFTQTLDISAAREMLGFAPQVGFAEGLARTFREPAP